MQEACPAGTALLEDCCLGILLPFHYCFSMFFDRFLFNVSSRSGVSMVAFLQPRAVHSGTRITGGRLCCQWARRHPLLGSWLHCWMHCRNTNPCAVRTTLGDPSPRRSSPRPASRHSTSYLPALGQAGANLSAGSGASPLWFSLLVEELSLAPALAVLVPVVPRDAYGSMPIGKS